MEPPDPSFADEFNVPQEDAVLSLTYAELHRFKVLVEAGLVAFSSACFEFANEAAKKARHGSLAHLPKVFPAIFTTFRRMLVWGSARRCLLASSLCCHAAFISASTPGPAHQLCAPRGRSERGTSSAAVERMLLRWSGALTFEYECTVYVGVDVVAGDAEVDVIYTSFT